jgi:phosphatidylserine/phosphatidylglycerophosphate/cardiolipin synthase-like enzyme
MATLQQLEEKYFETGAGAAAINSDNSTVEPLIDGAAYENAVFDPIYATTGSGDFIYILGWWNDFKQVISDFTTDSLGTALGVKAQAGVDVRVISWANPNLAEGAPWSLNKRFALAEYARTVEDNIMKARSLRAYKPTGATTPPLEDRILLDWSGYITGSHHQKAVVVKAGSDVTAFVAGIDFAPSRHDSPQHLTMQCTNGGGSGSSGTHDCGWHDAGVRVKGEAVKAVLANFKTRWDECSTLSKRRYLMITGSWSGAWDEFNPKMSTAPLATLTSALPTTGPRQSTQVLRSFGTVKEPVTFGSNVPWSTLPATGVREVEKTFLKALGAAQTYIYVEDQGFFGDPGLDAAIVAACKRGVKVVFLGPGENDTKAPGVAPPSSSIPGDVDDAIVDKLTTSEKQNFVYYRLDNVVVHSKILLIDDEFMAIGSANWMDRSMDGTDSELTVATVDAGKLVKDTRVALWAEHLRVDLANATVKAELEDLTRAMSIWRPAWGTAVTFTRPPNRLVRVGPP